MLFVNKEEMRREHFFMRLNHWFKRILEASAWLRFKLWSAWCRQHNTRRQTYLNPARGESPTSSLAFFFISYWRICYPMFVYSRAFCRGSASDPSQSWRNVLKENAKISVRQVFKAQPFFFFRGYKCEFFHTAGVEGDAVLICSPRLHPLSVGKIVQLQFYWKSVLSVVLILETPGDSSRVYVTRDKKK